MKFNDISKVWLICVSSFKGNVEDTDYAGNQIYHGKDNGWLGGSLAVGDAVLVGYCTSWRQCHESW